MAPGPSREGRAVAVKDPMAEPCDTCGMPRDEPDSLAAVVSRLQAENERVAGFLVIKERETRRQDAEIHALRAENERLRAALVAHANECPTYDDESKTCFGCFMSAALAGPPQEGGSE
jgi:hypothetical protein